MNVKHIVRIGMLQYSSNLLNNTSTGISLNTNFLEGLLRLHKHLVILEGRVFFSSDLYSVSEHRDESVECERTRSSRRSCTAPPRRFAVSVIIFCDSSSMRLCGAL